MSIRKEENGTYTVQVRVKDWTGKIVHKKKRGFTRRKDAKDWETQMQLPRKEFNVTLGEFADIYFEDKKNVLKERTIMHKHDVLNAHVLPYFADRVMSEITAADLIQWQNRICENPYQLTYRNDIQKEISALFTHAEKIYGLADNPCKRIPKMGKPDAGKMEFWTYDQYKEFISNIEYGTRHYVLFETLFWTGMRIGELLALTKADIRIADNQINIDKTYYRRNKRDYITPPKTEESVRIIEIPEFLTTELKEYMETIYGLEDNDRIFPIVPEAVQHKLKHDVEKYSLKKIRVHDFRHSHAAYLINQNVQPLLIKERFGHRDIRITLNIYGHLYPSKQKEVAAMLNEQGKRNDMKKGDANEGND